jgi:hypothetical protein
MNFWFDRKKETCNPSNFKPVLKSGPEKGQALRTPPVGLNQSPMPRSFRMNICDP